MCHKGRKWPCKVSKVWGVKVSDYNGKRRQGLSFVGVAANPPPTHSDMGLKWPNPTSFVHRNILHANLCSNFAWLVA